MTATLYMIISFFKSEKNELKKVCGKGKCTDNFSLYSVLLLIINICYGPNAFLSQDFGLG